MTEIKLKRNRKKNHSQKHVDDNSKYSKRFEQVLTKSAELFAQNGYQATSIRNIADHVGLNGGSLYYYIVSKEELFVKINEYALQSAADRILSAISIYDGPWDRFEAACIELLHIQLDPRSITMPLMNDFNSVPEELQKKIIVKRDHFEEIFTELIQPLPLGKKIDKDIYQKFLLSLLNNTSSWYHDEGRLSIDEIGQQVMFIFRNTLK